MGARALGAAGAAGVARLQLLLLSNMADSVEGGVMGPDVHSAKLWSVAASVRACDLGSFTPLRRRPPPSWCFLGSRGPCLRRASRTPTALHAPFEPPTIPPPRSPRSLAVTTSEFTRISGVVLGGLKSIFTNFAGVADQLSGPVAIVAKGSEIARTDSAGGGGRRAASWEHAQGARGGAGASGSSLCAHVRALRVCILARLDGKRLPTLSRCFHARCSPPFSVTPHWPLLRST